MKDITSKINEQLPFRGQFILSGIADLSPDVLDQLNSKEKGELEKVANLRRQREYVTSRILLKKMGEHFGANDISVHKDELGQPFGVAESQEFFVSIAHTNQMVFCGMSEHEAIGLDLEPIDRPVPEKLKQRIMHPDESQLFADAPAIRIWTIKEAFVKLRGQGLRLNMNQVRVKQEGADFFVELNNDKRAKICSFQMDRNWLAVAYFCE